LSFVIGDIINGNIYCYYIVIFCYNLNYVFKYWLVLLGIIIIIIIYFIFSQQGTTKVVFAYHKEDPTSDDGIKYHTYRGSKSILLLNRLDKKKVNETDWKEFIIQSRNVSNMYTELNL